ncbi:MAG: response regulator transcription factor [Bacteroidia bacterium]|nr:response regulator transcription factor [Bacteroidia bacterium]MCZ2276696.1 response regulator transcription factor [Bacteroidia bacterium]
MLTRILLVEDEPALADTIKLNLELEKYHVTAVADGKQAVRTFKEARFDLIVLDIMLPGLDGFSVCQAIRLENTQVPILMLTAKNTSNDRIEGLKIGADDYLTKPFNLEELLLRISNLLRRSQKKGSDKVQRYSLNGYEIDFLSHEVKKPDESKIQLTKKEAALLKLLIERKNEVISREHILETVWSYDVYPNTRTIDNFIVTFRKYFEPDPSHPKHFLSVRGVGYKFTD